MRRKEMFTNSVSLAFAFLSVTYAVLGIRYNHKVRYQLEFVNLPVNFAPTQKDINFSVEYSCSYVLKGILKSEQLPVEIDVSKYGVERSFFILNINTEEIVKRIPLCSIVSVFPKSINVELEKTHTKYVRVLPDVVGDVPPGYVFSFSVSPPYVMIKGPEQKIKDKDFIYTEVIDIHDRVSDFSIRIPLRKEEYLDVETDVVHVHFKIRPR